MLVLAYAGCCVSLEFGSARRAFIFGSVSSMPGVRLISHTTLPRHSTSIFWPGSIFEMSTSTGAPAAFARSLGQNDITNGVAAAIAPMPPTTLVAPIRNRRLLLSMFAAPPASLAIFAFTCSGIDLFGRPRDVSLEPA